MLCEYNFAILRRLPTTTATNSCAEGLEAWEWRMFFIVPEGSTVQGVCQVASGAVSAATLPMSNPLRLAKSHAAHHRRAPRWELAGGVRPVRSVTACSIVGLGSQKSWVAQQPLAMVWLRSTTSFIRRLP